MTDKSNQKIVDHLFRHQYGKMVAVLSRIFGLSNLELVEDAVQDTFINATLKWRNNIPENPEGWLMKAAKNRIVDLLRQTRAEKDRNQKVISGPSAFQLNEIFLDHEIEDSQLRMLFVACHPKLSGEEQIAFALKTISGFSMKEIAAALLQKEETIKKRLIRARKSIADQQIKLEFPSANELDQRISGVLQIIYLVFNEGFHSTKPDSLISKDLCGEALRLNKMLLTKESFRSGSAYALFALLCFHASRLDSKINDKNEIVDLEHQDRSKWYMPLIVLGNDALKMAAGYEDRSAYHIEAAIASEHVRAIQFENTNWIKILNCYQELQKTSPSDHNLLSLATVYLQLNDLPNTKAMLDQISSKGLSQRQYLLHGCYADYYQRSGDPKNAKIQINMAIESCSNQLEMSYLEKKKFQIENSK